MFLFCHHTGQHHYDFYPHKFGAYSSTLAEDQKRLIQQGYFQSADDFRIIGGKQYLQQLDTTSQQQLTSFAREFRNLRGKALIRSAYLAMPYYASRSEIASELLSRAEYERVQKTRNTDTSSRLFTLGYEGISVDRYLSKLIENNVHVLVDVRKNPISKKYGFSKRQLQKYVESIGIDYVHLPELGVPSNLRQNLDSPEAYEKLFADYEINILPLQTQALSSLRSIIATKHRVVLTCFEASYASCHRSRIALYFQNDPAFGIQITHL